MKNLLALIILALGLCHTASADVWKWTDVNGKTFFVDTMKPIFTWIGDMGKIHYSDTPDHEDAVGVVLIRASKGNLADAANESATENAGGYAYPGETAAQKAEREDAEAYYCKRATEIYDSYVNAPKLFKTNADGEREYLSDEAATVTIAETKTKKDELCR